MTFLLESGTQGHINHIYDDRTLSFKEIKKILTLLASGKANATEKVDGIQASFTYKDGEARISRNKSELFSLGFNKSQIENKEFKGGDQVKSVFLKALAVLDAAIKTLPEKIQNDVFRDGTIFYNAEIVCSQLTNVVKYDKNIITIHSSGHKHVNPEAKEIQDIPSSELPKSFVKAAKHLEEISGGGEFIIKMAAPVKMKNITGEKDLDIAKNRIDKLLSSSGLTDSNTVEDYLLTKAQPLSSRNDVAIKKAIYPLEDIIYDFSIEILKPIKSSYILNDSGEVKRIKKQLIGAIKTIQSSGREDAITILKSQLKKIKNSGNINTPVEGIVFSHAGKLYKMTGAFAPINQILGLLKYGRGKMPPVSHLEEVDINQERTIAILPGAFKPPHSGHYQMAKYFANKPEIDRVIVLISSKSRVEHTPETRIEVSKEMSKKVWELYTKNDEKIVPVISPEPSPVVAAYKALNGLNSGDRALMVLGKKESNTDDIRFDGVEAYVADNNLNIEVDIVESPMFAGAINSTSMRQLIANGKQEVYKKYLPSHLDNAERQEVWGIVTAPVLQENYQERVKSKHFKAKCALINTGEKANAKPYTESPSCNRSKSAPAGAGALEEFSSMAGGSIQGATNMDKKKFVKFMQEQDVIAGGLADEKKVGDFDPDELAKGVKVEMEHTNSARVAKEIAMDHLTEDPEYYTKLIQYGLEEAKLRKYIKKIVENISLKNKKNEELKLIAENMVRKVVRKLIKEESVDDEAPHDNTGINVLEQLLKKIIPILEEDYKLLTTSEEQRRSFRAHVVDSVQRSLAPGRIMSVDSFDKETDLPNDKAPLSMDSDQDGKLDMKIGDEASPGQDAAELDEQDTFDKLPMPAGFIDINKAKKKSFFVKGDEEGHTATGRNMASKSYEKVEKQIMDAFGLLDNREDEELFYDYLVTNIKLYFDKFENELLASIPEPTTDEYEQEKDRQDTEMASGQEASVNSRVGIDNEEVPPTA